ncbi:MAG: YidC/Oxa1 family insertase periplasmic-domain containing protein, partial [Bacteroidaceae bacterium]
MDKRSFIGISLITVIVLMVLLWSGNSQKKNAAKTTQYEQKLDSARAAVEDSIQFAQEATVIVTASQQDSLSPLFPAMNGSEELVVLDNGLVKIGISSKGATPSFAQLSGYNDQQGQNVTLFSQDEISLNFKIDGKNQNIQSRNLYFENIKNGANSVTMRLNTNGYGHMDFVYTLLPESYMLNLDIKASGMENFFSSDLSTLAVDWIQNLRQREKGFDFEQRYTTLTYKRADKVKAKVMNVSPAAKKSGKTTGRTTSKTIEEQLDWVAYKNQFFSCIMIASDTYTGGTQLSGQSYLQGLGYMKKLMAKTHVGFD